MVVRRWTFSSPRVPLALFVNAFNVAIFLFRVTDCTYFYCVCTTLGRYSEVNKPVRMCSPLILPLDNVSLQILKRDNSCVTSLCSNYDR